MSVISIYYDEDKDQDVKLEIFDGYDGWYAVEVDGDPEWPVAEGRDRRALGFDLISKGYHWKEDLS